MVCWLQQSFYILKLWKAHRSASSLPSMTGRQLRGTIVFGTPRWKLPPNNEVGEKASGSCSACLCLSGLMLLTISGVVIRRFPHCSFMIDVVLMRRCSLAFRGQSRFCRLRVRVEDVGRFRPFPAVVERNIACCHFSWVSCCTTLIQTVSYADGMLCR